MVFPGLSINKRELFNLNNAWKTSLLVLDYNIFDTIGKFLTKLHVSKKLVLIIILVIKNAMFFVFYYGHFASSNNILGSSYILLIALAVFGFLNGFYWKI